MTPRELLPCPFNGCKEPPHYFSRDTMPRVCCFDHTSSMSPEKWQDRRASAAGGGEPAKKTLPVPCDDELDDLVRRLKEVIEDGGKAAIFINSLNAILRLRAALEAYRKGEAR